jgi:hypothetical protein
MLLSALWLAVRFLPQRRQSAPDPAQRGSPGHTQRGLSDRAQQGAPRSLLAFLLGALPFTALFAQFHTAVYGAPWRTGYSFLENAGFQRDIAPGFMGISLPTGERIWGSFFSPALGLFFFAPWIALALGALPIAWRLWRASAAAPDLDKVTNETSAVTSSPEPGQRTARLALPSALAVFLYYLAFQSGHALWRSGWTVGPRYITPLVPFAAVAIAFAFQSLAPAARALATALLGGAGAAAILATGLASSVCQGFPDEPKGPLAEIVYPLLAHGWVPRNLLQRAGVPGLWSALPTFAALGIAAFLCLRASSQIEAPPRARKLSRRLALAVFSLLALGQWTSNAHAAPWGSAHFLSTQWTPANPPGAVPFE